MTTHRGTGRALVDGREVSLTEAALAVTDDGAVRGDGAFETVGVWGGRPFRLPDHLARLRSSLQAIGLPAPDPELLTAEAFHLVEGLGDVDAALRIYVTAAGTRVVTLADQPVRPAPRRLLSQPAPWIQPVGTYGPAGAKTMSYMPNMAATRAAQAAGADDALLVTLDGTVLEGPTFCVLWVVDGVLRTPDVSLGIVDSISRRTLLELAAADGMTVEAGAWPLASLADASEVLVCSAVRPLYALAQVDGWTYGPGSPVRDRLAAALDAARRHGRAR
jgi:branched-subunit amino acid aminotransferase/4-amino-4-deoxychorismate lyase